MVGLYSHMTYYLNLIDKIAFSGNHGFDSKDKLQRTPVTKNEDMDDGPLSSTRIENGREPVDREQVHRTNHLTHSLII